VEVVVVVVVVGVAAVHCRDSRIARLPGLKEAKTAVGTIIKISENHRAKELMTSTPPDQPSSPLLSRSHKGIAERLTTWRLFWEIQRLIYIYFFIYIYVYFRGEVVRLSATSPIRSGGRSAADDFGNQVT
jgi:hypothetical protein